MEQHTGSLNLRIVEASSIPLRKLERFSGIRPNVDRFAHTFQVDPLRMISSGALAAEVPPDRVKDVKNALTKIGVLLSDVGQFQMAPVCNSCSKKKPDTIVKFGAKKMN